MIENAPLFLDTYDIVVYIMQHVSLDNDNISSIVTRKLHETAIALLEAVVFALNGNVRARYVSEADDRLALLRVLLRMALDCKLIEKKLFLSLFERLNGIGRQIGGWKQQLPVVG